MQGPRQGHIRIIDFLRGIAALLVVVIHFGSGGLPTIKGTFLHDVFKYGQYGVQIFFVISGFIIPYALYRSGYETRNFFRHVARRFIRIDPPAYISLLLVFILYFGAVFILGRPINGMDWPGTSARTIFANLTYTVDYLNTGWYNGVFWTLAIEFQFYLLVGLLLPLLLKANEAGRTGTLIAVLLMYHLPGYSFFNFGSFFVMGIVLFLEREGLLKRGLAMGLLILACIACVYQRGTVEASFAIFAVICIRWFSFSTKISDHLGKISFSLYLTHFFAGWTAEIFVKKVLLFIPEGDWQKLLMFTIYLLWAIVFATVYHKYIEYPFVTLSKRVRWRGKEDQVLKVQEQPG